MQNDERANYQLDVKFQESYLSKVVSLLQCQLSEGAFCQSGSKGSDMVNNKNCDRSEAEEIEDGELPDSYGKNLVLMLVMGYKLLHWLLTGGTALVDGFLSSLPSLLLLRDISSYSVLSSHEQK